MRTISLSLLACTCLVSAPLFAQSAGQNPVDISNVFRVEYDDNVFSSNSDSATGKVDSMKLVESIEFLFDTEKGPTYFGIVYAPSVVYFEDRPNDDTDVNHLLDASVIHKFSPTRVLQVKETLRRSDEPELIEDDVTIRKNNDFFYNSFNASYTTEVMPEKMSLRVDGRYVLLRYDEGDVARASDYDQLTGGVDASYELDPNTSAGGQVRYSVLDYENGLRDSDSVQVGGTVSKIFGPSLQGNARAGYEFRDASNAVETSSESPYLDGSLVYLPGKNTQLTVGAGYSLDKSPVNTFTQQERFRVYANANYSISPALRLNLSGSISEGSFDASDATTLFDPQVDTDGDESVIQTTVGLTYRVNVRNSLLATYQYTDLDSDVRPGSTFTRNRISLGWQYNL